MTRSHRLSSLLALTMSVAAIASCSSGMPEDPGSPGSPASSEQGRVLVGRPLSPDEVGYFQMAVDGSGEAPFAVGEQFEVRQLSPDGGRLSIVGVGDADAMVGGVVGVDGSGLAFFESADPSLNLACGVWAPHDRMACEGWDEADPSRAGIYTVRADDGGDLRRLTHASDVPCDYSPDGGHLAFVRIAEDGVGTLMVMEADGADVRSLAGDIALSGVSCDWSPDGASIVVGSVDGRLMLVTPDAERTAFPVDGVDGFASGGVWSPDGTRLLFSMITQPDDLSAVYVVSRDGSDLVRLTDDGAYEEAAAWLS